MREQLEKRIEDLKKGMESITKKINEYQTAIQELVKSYHATNGALQEAERMLKEMESSNKVEKLQKKLVKN